MHELEWEATVWGRIKIVFVIFLAMPLVPHHQMAAWLHADIFHPIEHVEGVGANGQSALTGCMRKLITHWLTDHCLLQWSNMVSFLTAVISMARWNILKKEHHPEIGITFNSRTFKNPSHKAVTNGFKYTNSFIDHWQYHHSEQLGFPGCTYKHLSPLTWRSVIMLICWCLPCSPSLLAQSRAGADGNVWS